MLLNDELQTFANARTALFTPYVTPTELEEIRRRQMLHLQEWPPLFAQARALMESGASANDPSVQALARSWRSLYKDSYCGDDEQLAAKVGLAFQREPELMAGDGVDEALIVYVHRAVIALEGPRATSANAGPKPSALMVATLRAAHQLLDSPLVLHDPLALKILGPTDEAALKANVAQYQEPMAKALRASMVVRSRLAEDSWEKAEQGGARQYVILGAGLDTYAYRRTSASGRVFEVDLPDTQAWKRDCLRAAGIAEPSERVTYVATNFEHGTLAQTLAGAGFNKDEPAIFAWLGVAVYLEEEAILDTLRFIASCAPGSAVVFDYVCHPSVLSPMERVGLELVRARVAAQGEPWKSYFEPIQLANMLTAMGFGQANNISPDALNDRYLANRQDGLRMGGVARLMHASV